jgi:hypothetical protein
MSVSATITVYRVENDEDVEIEVTVEGQIERFGSYNPHEAGLHIGDWDVVDPKGFVLSSDESDRAIEALEQEI